MNFLCGCNITYNEETQRHIKTRVGEHLVTDKKLLFLSTEQEMTLIKSSVMKVVSKILTLPLGGTTYILDETKIKLLYKRVKLVEFFLCSEFRRLGVLFVSVLLHTPDWVNSPAAERRFSENSADNPRLFIYRSRRLMKNL